MNKHKAHHYYRYVKPIKWQLLVVGSAASGVASLFELRANSEHMATLRQAVYDADKTNNNVQAALSKLQSYVTAHMNTNLNTGQSTVYPPIQLQYTYQRLIEQQGSALQTSNTDLYTQAEASCEQQIPTGFSGRYRLDCITKYVQDHGAATTVHTATVSPSLYQFAFASPKWSPDAAGLSMLCAAVLLLAAVSKFALDRWFK